ncbi:MAG: TlpA family protein disulfide reductase [Paludibacteraceae bacterium]|nr:TlpA family protein disulfide reductase [Paludibacteraceae bacterium]
MQTRIVITTALALILASCVTKQQKTQDNSEQTPSTEEVLVSEAAQTESETESTDAGNEQPVFAPDFTLNDINGQPLTLSSLRGKYVVLDFWGSWCKWCIKGMPEMKEYYAKYAGKFEILGIDCGDNEADWKTAVKANALPWLHVYNPDDSFLTEQYEIQGYPTKIILSPDGSIHKTIIGEDPAFYEELDRLFGE